MESLELVRQSSMPDNVIEEDVVLFAVPKKGRLNEKVMQLLNGAGLEANRPDRLDVAKCKDLPVKLVFLPASDIPSYVMEGNVDIGISGGDMLEEHLLDVFNGKTSNGKAAVEVKMKLGFGKCKLCLQAPKELCKDPASNWVGKRIVTSFPRLTEKFFADLDKGDGKSTKIRVVSGSVEAACGLGLADAVVDLVETGTTMRAAGLEVVADIFASEAMLIEQPKDSPNRSKVKQAIIEVIEDRLKGYQTAMKHVMVVYNVHEKDMARCASITPGKKSPTVTKLDEEGWFSVSSLVDKAKSGSIMDELDRAGAKDILCFQVANTRM
eukprot:TRINITY_DN113215_c0_g1_i1.p1 TRINITY_DN113215_c0_g1~~TRINITY_DN113215_c0_g1_i1.p1  ORF type:complete len:324 (+),score=99.19 TRINITY_DN113215_c0_g1_i1:67-1038(+)